MFTIRQSIFIAQPRERVWDFTQNYRLRHEWDQAVIEATVLETVPRRTVRLRLKGNVIMTLTYTQDERPYKTTLATISVRSPLILSAGGSWVYEATAEGTIWTQTNTIVLRKGRLLRLLQPIIKAMFLKQTRRSMKTAKRLLS
jgi:hypothetical protein